MFQKNTHWYYITQVMKTFKGVQIFQMSLKETWLKSCVI